MKILLDIILGVKPRVIFAESNIRISNYREVKNVENRGYSVELGPQEGRGLSLNNWPKIKLAKTKFDKN